MNYRVAVLGATGNVGREILAILKERKFPFSSLHALASDKIPNRKVSFGDDLSIFKKFYHSMHLIAKICIQIRPNLYHWC